MRDRLRTLPYHSLPRHATLLGSGVAHAVFLHFITLFLNLWCTTPHNNTCTSHRLFVPSTKPPSSIIPLSPPLPASTPSSRLFLTIIPAASVITSLTLIRSPATRLQHHNRHHQLKVGSTRYFWTHLHLRLLRHLKDFLHSHSLLPPRHPYLESANEALLKAASNLKAPSSCH